MTNASDSFVHLFDTHVETVYRYVHLRCRDHALAEDITQETFMAAIRRHDDPSMVTIGWLQTVARNRLIDVLRRKTRYDQKLRLVAATGVEDEVDIAERLRVEAALDELPMHYRLVLMLRYINGLSVRAIAKELDRTEKSVESLVTQARRALTKILELDAAVTDEGRRL